MAGPESLGFLSFRRTFTLLIFLVVLPSAALSGFGILAIVNERAAVEKRLEDLWANRLTKIRDSFALAFESAVLSDHDVEVAELLIPIVPFKKNLALGIIETDDPSFKTALESMKLELDKLPERTVLFSLPSTSQPHLVVASRRANVIVGGRISEQSQDTLLEALGKELIPESEAKLSLVPVKRETPEGLVQRLVTGVSEAKQAALAPSKVELASIPMPSSTQDFRLVVTPLGEDPIQAASTRNRWWYVILLTLFYVILVLGVIFTGRTLYREARLSRMKTDFVSLMSHELRTPMTSIRMFIEMLATHRVRDEAQMNTVVELLSKETVRLSSMIESVLDWARIESGRKEYQTQHIAVDELIATAVAAFRTGHLDAAYTLNVQSLPGARVHVDTEAIGGALLNLLNNAFKYTNENKIISLRAARKRNTILIKVEDNGIGIAKSDLRKIFERFYRADSLLSRSTEGTGLGLSIARRIVEAHKGKMSVESRLGKGSTFTIHLPADSAGNQEGV
jgi:two-component system, OmpR family, phosphate regulon sensor histidine kinase PhoR